MSCNIVKGQKRVNQPIPVRVKLLGEDQQAAPQTFLRPDSPSPFEARLTDPGGREYPLTLTPSQTERGIYEGVFFQNTDQPTACGDVSLQVSFLGTYDENLYVMKEKQDSVRFSRVESDGVVVKTAKELDASYAIHPGFCSNAVMPVSFRIKIEDLAGKRLSMAAVAAGDPAQLYQIRLVGPDPAQYEDLQPVLEQQGDGDVLSVTGGLTVTTPGEYFFEVKLNPAAFKAGWVPIDPETVQQVKFKREDILANRPQTCGQVKTVSASVMFLVAALFIFLMTGGPGGRLEILSSGGDLLLPMKLSWMRFPQPIRKKLLIAMGIGSIHYRRAGRNQLQVTVYEVSGEAIYTGLLNSGEEYPVTTDHSMVYRGKGGAAKADAGDSMI